MQQTLRVAANTNPKSLAWALCQLIKDQTEVEMVSVGPRAVNAAVKAAIIARGFLATQGKDIHIVPAFVRLDDGQRTGIRFFVRAKAA
jgi:stage V sporulation protein S